MIKWMKVSKLLVKTYSNWCVTLVSMFIGNKVRNIIDNSDDNNYGAKAWSATLSVDLVPKKLNIAWEVGGMKHCRPEYRVHSAWLSFVYRCVFCNFAQLWLVEFKYAEPIRCFQPNVAFPPKSAVPLQVSIISVSNIKSKFGAILLNFPSNSPF